MLPPVRINFIAFRGTLHKVAIAPDGIRKPFADVGVPLKRIRTSPSSGWIIIALTPLENPALASAVDCAVLIRSKILVAVFVTAILLPAADWNASMNMVELVKDWVIGYP